MSTPDETVVYPSSADPSVSSHAGRTVFDCPNRQTPSVDPAHPDAVAANPEFPLSCHHVSTPVADLLDQAAVRPDAPLLLWDENGTTRVWTYRQFAAYSRACAAVLHERGVSAGDRVALVCRNSAQRQAWQYGTWWLGAVEVSVNYDLTGDLLADVIEDCDPQLVVLDDEFRNTVRALAPGRLSGADDERFLDTVADLPSVDAPGPGVPDASDAESLDVAARSITAETLSSLIYTSGTTGPSKGVMLPAGFSPAHGHTIAHVAGLTPEDTAYFVLPFFHVDFHVVFSAIVLSGGSVAIRPKFTASGFWPEVARYNVTWTWTVGFLFSAIRTEGPDAAADTTLRRIIGAPIPEGTYEYFEDRLGIDILTLYGQTEADGPLYDTPDHKRRGAAGWPSVGFEVQIHDEHGHEVTRGTAGELVYRPRFPHMVMLGYWNRPEATAETWRDLWVHSGDRGAMDEDGFVVFLGRMADSIRRRGENVSAYELETILRKAPGVEECAAVGVADDFSGEQEIKVFVVPADVTPGDVDGGAFDIAGFEEFCRNNVPRHAMPQFLQLTEAKNIVRSPGTQVVQKHRLLQAVAEEEETTGVTAVVHTLQP